MADTLVPSATDSTLYPEAALATRIVRKAPLPYSLLNWLAAPAKTDTPDIAEVHDSLVESMGSLLNPLLEDASSFERKQGKEADRLLAATVSALHAAFQDAKVEQGSRLIAVSLLPLYRSLATGEFNGAFEQTRYRLFEATALLALCQELEHDLTDVLDAALSSDESPYQTLADRLDINLLSLGELVRRIAPGYNVKSDAFDDRSTDRIIGFGQSDVSKAAHSVPNWSEPELLWTLAAELQAEKPNLVLPRAWIETPVPWHSIIEHWSLLAKRLEDPSSQKSGEQSSSDQKNAPEVSDKQNDQTDTDHDSVNAGDKTPGSTQSESSEPNESSADESASLATPDFVLPKVLIAEVLSHNDPAFVNLIRRQLATCRSEARSICLATLTVVPENERNRIQLCGKRTGGVCPWHQQLVNQLADHPDVGEPFAFITTDGELLVSMLDIERDEATTILREAFEEILGTNRRSDDAESLEAVKPTGRYYAGIASTHAPNGGMSPEQLIEAICRCLKAATCQSKSALKSIEVF